MKRRQTRGSRVLWGAVFGVVAALAGPRAGAGPYSAGLNDPDNPYDAPVPGFVGPAGAGVSPQRSDRNYANPLFVAWAGSCEQYLRADSDRTFSQPAVALGPVTGDPFDVVSLGDLTAEQLAQGNAPGTITLVFDRPIRNLSGADFVVFENGFVAGYDTGGSGAGGMMAELAYVEVSQDGVEFVRFEATSLTAEAVGSYGTLDPTDVHHLAGKHANSYGDSWGTPFDLADVGLEWITHIRLVDVVGNGSSADAHGNPIYDPWLTFGSGGFDLDAIGSISTWITYAEWLPLQSLPEDQRGELDDPDGDGIPNLLEYAFALVPWERNGSGEVSRLERGENGVELVFRRDERVRDLVYEVQVSNDLLAWTTIARSVDGRPVEGVEGWLPEIAERTASGIAGVEVIREVRVRDVLAVGEGQSRFLRVAVIREGAAE